MYKLILFVFLSVIAIFKAQAQEKVTIHSAGTYFVQPVTDKKWKNINGENFTEATYKYYNGLTYVTLTAAKDTEASLKYDIAVKEGKLEMELINEKGETVFTKIFSNAETGSFKAKLIAGEIYKVNFKGNATSGSYKVEWK